MDYSKLANPFDFANPVMDPELFAGRTKEMNDISYYLDHASRAARAINLAIMGERASGKTSILNKIESLALEQKFCVVRVDLDEGDAHTQMGFFYKIFDSLLTTVCSNGSYGGLLDKTYQTYRNMVDAFDIPDDKTFCPFIFPFQYANTARRGNEGAILSDTGFKEDISQIQKESNRRVLLVFDECDVLAASRVHLEKLRNIFMNTSGFMLVFAGTPKLFPVMDDVFSPIVRQFKKINLGPFDSIDDTEKCILRPLEKVGVTDASDILSRETLREVHEVSGGRPYEVQLICHSLFRRIQENRAKRLEINVDVLDDVKKELETSQDVSLRPFLAAVRNLTNSQLSALQLLCAANNHATFDQIWFTEFVFRETERWTNESLKKHFTKFGELGLLTETDGIIKCLGDEFDKVYCKYFARKRKVVLSINDRPYDIFVLVRLNSLLRRQFKDAEEAAFPLVIGGSEKANLAEIAGRFLDESADAFESRAGLARSIYKASLDFQNHSSLKFATVTISTPWNTVYATYLASGLDTLTMENILAELSRCSARAGEVGGALTVEFDEITPIPLDVLMKKVDQSANSEIRQDLYFDHFIRMGEAYLERRDMKEALIHAELAFRYNSQPGGVEGNNLGYVFMIWEQYLLARQLFEMSIAKHKLSEDKALPSYNLGVVLTKQGLYEQALAQFRLAKELRESGKGTESTVKCLAVPKIGTDKELQFEEIWDPLLSKTAESAIAALNLLAAED